MNLSDIKGGNIDKIINESAKFKTGSEILNESIKKSMQYGGSTFGKGQHVFKEQRTSSINQTSILVQQTQYRPSQPQSRFLNVSSVNIPTRSSSVA